MFFSVNYIFGLSFSPAFEHIIRYLAASLFWMFLVGPPIPLLMDITEGHQCHHCSLSVHKGKAVGKTLRLQGDPKAISVLPSEENRAQFYNDRSWNINGLLLFLKLKMLSLREGLSPSPPHVLLGSSILLDLRTSIISNSQLIVTVGVGEGE